MARRLSRKFFAFGGVALLALSLVVSPVARAAFSETVNYQGKLADAAGDVVADGDYDIEFKLYTVSSGGSAIWTETRSGVDAVEVVDGLFSVRLGEIASLSGVNFDQPLWLGVNVEADGEMTPRKAMSAVPAAFVAKTAKALDATYATSTFSTSTASYVSGSLAIATTSPSAIFAVQGNAFIAGTTTVRSLAATSTVFINGLPLASQVTGAFQVGASAGLGATNATYSNFLGLSAGSGATNAYQSNFFGTNSGLNASSAYYANFLGYGAGQSATNAGFSNFLGYAAGQSATNAQHSNFSGYYAGYGATNASYSNFFGQSSGQSATGASYSNFMGYNAGTNASSASGSNFFGSLAGYSATDAGGSNFFGGSAGFSATYAQLSNFLGADAGYFATYASSSNFLGLSAGRNASNAADSNFLGRMAGSDAYSAYSSNFLGPSAGQGAYGANNSNFLGAEAGLGAYSAANANFLGAGAGSGATGAAVSNFFGLNAGSGATGASNSNFLGSYSGSAATGANDSNFLGQSAGSYASSAFQSNFLGNFAGGSASSAYQSNFIGASAGYVAHSANNSNFFGPNAGYGASSASHSNFIGSGAGQSATNAANSIFIGSYSGLNDSVNNTGGGTSIAIGRYSGTGGFSNSIAIGRGVKNSSTLQANVGNVLYLTGIYNSDTQSSAPVAAGNLGVGTTTPFAKLSVHGMPGGSNFLFAVATSTLSSTTTAVVVDRFGYLGVGTTTPTAMLAVAGSSYVHATSSAGTIDLVTTGSGGQPAVFLGGVRFMHGYSGLTIGNAFLGTNSGNFSMGSAGYNTGIGANALTGLTAGDYNTALGANALTANSGGGGNVALGADTLAANLSGFGNVAIGRGALGGINGGSADYNVGIGYYAGDNLTNGARNIIIGNQIDATSTTMTGGLIIGNLIYGTGLDGTGTTLSSGSVGVGTTTPSAKLAVAGSGLFSGDLSAARFVGTSAATSTLAGGIDIASGCFAVNGVCVGGGSGSSNWTVSGADIYRLSNVGVGTTTPWGALGVSTTTNSSAVTNGLAVSASGVGAGSVTAARFLASASSGLSYGVYVEALGPTAKGIYSYSDGVAVVADAPGGVGVEAYGINAVEAYSADAGGRAVYLEQSDSSGYGLYASAAKNYISGSLGIGTTSPARVLSVAGDAYVTNNLRLGSQSFVSSSGAFLDIYDEGNGPIFENTSSQTWEARGFGGYAFLDGNFGVGTTTPMGVLSVKAADGERYALSSYGGTGTSGSRAGSGYLFVSGEGYDDAADLGYGGDGGSMVVRLGNGGDVTTVDGFFFGGDGGSFRLTAGNGGAASNSAGGDGGNLAFQSGFAGVNGSGSGSVNGLVSFNAAGGNVVVGSDSATLAATSSARLSVIAASTTVAFNVATSTGYATSLFHVSATTTGPMDYARVAVGTTTTWGAPAGLLDQFTVAGRIYSTWRYASCEGVRQHDLVTTIVAANVARACGDFSFVEDTDGNIAVAVNNNPPFLRLQASTAASFATGEGASFRYASNQFSSTVNPVFEAYVRPQSGTATVRYMIGMSDAAAAGLDTDPANGAYFRAHPGFSNWVAVTTVGSVSTYSTTSVAVDASNFQRMRVELTSTEARFYIGGTLVARHTTSIPGSAAYLTPIVGVVLIGTDAVKNLDVSSIRFWWDDPPAEGFLASDETAEESVLPIDLSALDESASTTEAIATSLAEATVSGQVGEYLASTQDTLRLALEETYGWLSDGFFGTLTALRLNVGEMLAAAIGVLPGGTVTLPEGADQIVGSSILPASSTAVIVYNEQVRLNSKIILTPTSPVSVPLVVVEKTEGVSFKVSVAAAQAEDVSFDWLIVQAYSPIGIGAASTSPDGVEADEPGATVFDDGSGPMVADDDEGDLPTGDPIYSGGGGGETSGDQGAEGGEPPAAVDPAEGETGEPEQNSSGEGTVGDGAGSLGVEPESGEPSGENPPDEGGGGETSSGDSSSSSGGGDGDSGGDSSSSSSGGDSGGDSSGGDSGGGGGESGGSAE